MAASLLSVVGACGASGDPGSAYCKSLMRARSSEGSLRTGAHPASAYDDCEMCCKGSVRAVYSVGMLGGGWGVWEREAEVWPVGSLEEAVGYLMKGDDLDLWAVGGWGQLYVQDWGRGDDVTGHLSVYSVVFED